MFSTSLNSSSHIRSGSVRFSEQSVIWLTVDNVVSIFSYNLVTLGEV